VHLSPGRPTEIRSEVVNRLLGGLACKAVGETREFREYQQPPRDFSADRDGARNLYKVLRTAFPDFPAEIHCQISDGDRVITFKTYHGTYLGEFGGIAPTGKKIQFETVDVWVWEQKFAWNAIRSPTVGYAILVCMALAAGGLRIQLAQTRGRTIQLHSFIHRRTLLPRHSHFPLKQGKSVTHVSGTMCYPCPDRSKC
jgi:hypothetical protein